MVIRPVIAFLTVAAGWYGYLHLAGPWNLAAAGAGGLVALAAILIPSMQPTKRSPLVAKLGGMTWTMEDFCRGWLITGDTGSGKTRSGITPLLYQVFKNAPGWGGLCIDDKGLYWETLSEMARHFHRENDLILLQVRPDSPTAEWKPTHTFNLTYDRGVPFGTYAKFVVDTASSLGQQGDKGFFKSQAQTHMGTEFLPGCSIDQSALVDPRQGFGCYGTTVSKSPNDHRRPLCRRSSGDHSCHVAVDGGAASAPWW